MDTEPLQVRVPRELLQAIDDYRRDQPDLPTRPEAVRRVLTAALLPASLAD